MVDISIKLDEDQLDQVKEFIEMQIGKLRRRVKKLEDLIKRAKNIGEIKKG